MQKRQPRIRSLLVAILSIAPAAIAACTPPPAIEAKLRLHADVSVYEELGSWFGDRHQFACAAQAYREAIGLSPGSPRLLYLLGLSLYSAGNVEQAIPPLQQSIDIAPEVLKPHLLLGTAYAQLKQYPQANAQWQAAVKIDPRSPIALDGLSHSLLAEGKYAEVVDLLRQAPPDENLAIDLSQAYVQLKMFDDADKVLTSALKQQPTSARVANALISVDIKQFRFQDAEKLGAKTAQQHPNDLATQKLYLQTLVLAGNRAVARPLAKRWLVKAPRDFDLLLINAVQEREAGELENARKHLQEAVTINPNSSTVHFELGLVLSQLNDPAGVKVQMQRALELGAVEPEVHLELAKALRSLGETADAAEQLKLYQQRLQQQHAGAVAASKMAQGDKEMAAGNPGKAAALYHEALDATPDDPQLNFKLAVALDGTGDISGERAALEKAIQINPDLAVAYNQLGFLASKSGDSAAAEKHFREALRAAPGFTEAWVNLAATLGLQSRFEEAQQADNRALQLDPKNPQALLLRDTLAKALAQH